MPRPASPTPRSTPFRWSSSPATSRSYFYGRHPHQEVNLHQDADQFQIFRPFCKRVYRVDHVEDLPRIVERAFHLAQTGRPGPVLVDVPMDLFSADLEVDAFATTPPEIAKPGLDPATAARIVDALAPRERPVLYAGGGVLSARATAELAGTGRGAGSAGRAYADGEGLPAARAIRCCSDSPDSGARRSPTRSAAPPMSSSRLARGSPRRTRARGMRGSRSPFRRRG